MLCHTDLRKKLCHVSKHGTKLQVYELKLALFPEGDFFFLVHINIFYLRYWVEKHDIAVLYFSKRGIKLQICYEVLPLFIGRARKESG